MNILFLTSKNPYSDKPFGGGAETSCRLMAENMSTLGHKVLYLSERVTEGDIARARDERVQLLGYNTLLFSRFVSGRQSRGLALLTAILSNKIDVLYCFFELRNLRLALQTRRYYPRLRVVMRMAGLAWHDDILKRPNRKTRYQAAFNSIDCVNFIHDNLESMVQEKLDELEMAVEFRKSFVLDVGTKAQAVAPPKTYSKDTPLKLVMASRFADYHKRQDILIEAMSLLNERSNASLTFIGEGKKLEESRNKVARLGLEERVDFLPFLPQNVLWNTLAGYDLLCHCADYEGLGKTIVEAMSIGLPVLVSDVSPMNAYVAEGETGFLSANTPEDWARKIADIEAAPQRLPQVSKASLAYAKTHFDHMRKTEIYIEEFGKVLK
ncbi:glycosyltransferase family 4 protein [Roseibium album]|uniref:glycosyltransferase family 4 protein n=1 Tax=Roseibium album TaxID=311410 RepID=UPI00249306FD|nr:glycosyltransferase family 4 protein [Roseibium album]